MQCLRVTVSNVSQISASSGHGVLNKYVLVDTDQTKHMDKRIIEHQERNIPLERFAKVCTNVEYLVYPLLTISKARRDHRSSCFTPVRSCQLYDWWGVLR